MDPIAEVREDHKKVRDTLLDIMDLIRQRDVTKSLEQLLVLDKLGGPHFQMEEEVMYPIMKRFYGDDYYERLLEEHDRVIKAAKQIGETFGKGSITEEEVTKLIKLIQNEILPHPITCSGLEILMERLSPEELNEIAKSITVTRETDTPLLEWATTTRSRET
ncbi:MAG: hemerythrin domain-containing protein [Nitrososphaeria archaeon]|nr:hemerythrin domain-containing protein [Nitrososphaeria archaeon]NIQ33247.1 hemerythrin domain-containing protein [Nitrososphaeria archaeon]